MKIILFCVLNMFYFVIKCGFALKIAYFLMEPRFFNKLGFWLENLLKYKINHIFSPK